MQAPKHLVGAQQNAIKAGNNAIYNITDCSMVLVPERGSDTSSVVRILLSRAGVSATTGWATSEHSCPSCI